MMGGPQQGKASAGMVSQDSGTLGQVDRCQVAVTGYAIRPQAAWPVAVRLSRLQT